MKRLKEVERDQVRETHLHAGPQGTSVVWDFETKIWKERVRWYARVSFQKQDDIDLFFCPWLEYNLSSWVGDLGYSASAFTREGLGRKIVKVKAEIMEPIW